MNLLTQLRLGGLRFHAFHGFYPEEQVTGTEFIVDVEVAFQSSAHQEDDLSGTVNYERLQELVVAQMAVPRKLIERVAQGILQDIRQEFEYLDRVTVRLRKMHPPLKGDVDHAEIELTYIR